LRAITLVVFVLDVLAFMSGSPAVVHARGHVAGACQFVLGFADLHDLIPDIVGSCTSDEQHNLENGDAFQTTTTGLLVWRKLDNWTAFTDGASTWIDGPFGLQQRSDNQRFWWESNPDRLPILPPQTGDRCHTAGLALAATDQGGAGVGHQGTYFAFTNRLDLPCTFQGYVGAQLLDQNSNPLPTSVTRGGGYLFHDGGPVGVVVAPGGSARFGLEWTDVPLGSEATCATASQLAVIPPDEYDAIVVPAKIMACGGGQLRVTAVEPLNAPAPRAAATSLRRAPAAYLLGQYDQRWQARLS
jgi:hypothetical protein